MINDEKKLSRFSYDELAHFYLTHEERNIPDEDGMVLFHHWVSNDNIDGPFTEWHPNGQMWQDGYMKIFKWDGDYKRWDKKGSLVEHKLYENNSVIKDYLGGI